MERKDAIVLLKANLKNKNLVKHCIATEGAMEVFADKFGEDRQRWAIAGLLHDLDYEFTKDDFLKHGIKTCEMLEKEGFEDSEILEAIKMHTGNVEATTNMGKAIYAVDPATGFITACVLMAPHKNIFKLDMKFMLKRFKEKRFAAGASREQMRTATENFDLTLEQFLNIVLDGMKGKHEELGLGIPLTPFDKGES